MKKIYKYIFVALAGIVASQSILTAAAGDDKGDASNIKLFKKTVPTENEDEYLITLDSYVTGTKVVTQITKPVDLMLVLDVSTSMAANCQGNPAAWTLGTFEKLTTGDKINSVLHTNTSGDSNYSAAEGNTLRYRIKLSNSNTVRNLLYHDNNWYYDDNGQRTSWGYNGNNWTKYTANSADIIYTDVKIDLLQEACRVFLDELKTNSLGKDGVKGNDDDVDIRVGISTYCGTLKTNNNYDIVPVSVDANYTALIGKINNLHNNMGGSTDPSLSFDDVKNNKYPNLTTALKKEGKTDEQIAERSKVVVMFTDGKPQDGTHGNDLNYLINSSHNLKALGAKVYTIGIFDDPNAVIRNEVTINQYMTYLSSEYPDATGYSQTARGQKSTDGIQYYYSDTGAKLSEIFQSIAEAAGADTYNLTKSDAAAIDVMSDDFTLPAELFDDDVTDEQRRAHVTLTQWVCIAYDESKEDGDETIGGVQYKYRGGYTFKKYTNNPSDKILDTDAPFVYEIDEETQRVVVNGFDYAVDDVTTTSGSTITVNKYGNWVGKHADGQYAGKMLEISFTVKLKPESMGGYGLPSNKTTSGIYTNTGTTENPKYEKIVSAYPLPVVDVPSLMIIKEGLKDGESSIFTVTNKAGSLKYKVILTQKGTSICYAVIKGIPADDYTVTETDWAWTYKADEAYGTSKTLTLGEPKIPHVDGNTPEQDAAAYKTTVLSAQSANWATYGTLTNQANGNDLYYVAGDALHLMFKFVNSPKTGLPLNDEDVVLNVFGEGGGSAEHGGVDPEDHDME